MAHPVKHAFDRDGFVQIPAVFSRPHVRELRSLLTSIFDAPARYEGDGPSGRASIAVRYPELRWILTHPPFLSGLRSVLGEEFVYLPEMSAHRDNFSTWHTDTSSLEAAGNRFHLAPDFLMLQAAVYLQDNGERGGGIDVVPGSHRHPDPLAARMRAKGDIPGRRVDGHEGGATIVRQDPPVPPRSVSIPGKAGDLILFHLRTRHRATPRVEPIAHPKLALFFVCSADAAHARTYTRYLSSRKDCRYVAAHRWPAELLTLEEHHHLQLAS